MENGISIHLSNLQALGCLVGAGVICYLIYFLANLAGYYECLRIVNSNLDNMEESKRNELLVKGEQIGYVKGLEAGESQSQLKLREEFIRFLEEQLVMLKGGTIVAAKVPKPVPPKPVEYVRGGADRTRYNVHGK